ncbi:hypothetical protein GCM10010331_24530 [Streptomyces xanthochromogenes]|uniref:hypothetical protein n=1 Tax=Streptomyces xanthochromogenes TaxID=67384 RepID=UPI001674E6E4|nr:hypothetical protein [Streptomyces xanthochromogenes]GHB36204.1 hypothetical protein GCM10010331_24530 [Streptomyces xanthochromogenes]
MTGRIDKISRSRVADAPFPPELWAEAVYSRRSIPATLAAGQPAPGRTAAVLDPPHPLGPGIPLASPPLQLAPSPAAPTDASDPAVLAALVHYSYGLLQHDLTPGGWPLHRAVASARCRYPSELTLITPTGAFRYDPLHHQLAFLEASMTDSHSAELETPRFIVITSRFARTARLYGDYAPRLCAQEAGMLLGSVHLVAAALGLRTRAGRDRETLSDLCAPWSASAREHPMGYLELEGAMKPGPTAAEGPRHPPGRAWPPSDLASVLRSRHSGAAIFDPEPAPVTGELIADLETALDTVPFGDFSCHLLVQRSTDLAPGHYVHSDGRLGQVGAGDPLALLERIGQTEGRVSMNFRSTACVAYLAVRRGSAVARYGADAFRRLHLTAGAAAHQICVIAARHGLSARIHNGYEAATAERLLGLVPGEETVVFQLAIGAARPSASFRLPVMF